MEDTLALQAAREVSELLPIVQNNVMRRFNANSSAALTPLQLEALRVISDDGPMAMNVIANRMHMSKQQLTRFIDSLVRKGYLERKYMENNRRTIYIDITEGGHQIMRDYYLEALDFHCRDFANFTDEELTKIRDAAYSLRTLLARI